MDKNDARLVSQMLREEKRIKQSMQPIIDDIAKISSLVGNIQEEAENAVYDVNKKIQDISKILKTAKAKYRRKERKMLKFQENKKLLLDHLYKKYEYKQIQAEIRKHKKELRKQVIKPIKDE